MEAWGCYAAYRKQEDIKNVDHMMVNYDIATVEEFTWPHIRMERLFLQFIKNKLSSLDKFRPLNYHKTLNEKFPPLTCLVWIPAPLPLPALVRGGGELCSMHGLCHEMENVWTLAAPLKLKFPTMSFSFTAHKSTRLMYQGVFRKTRHECAMSKKRHILINLGQSEDEMPLACKFKVAGVRKC